MIKLDLTYLFAKRPGRLYIIAALFAIIGIMTLPRTIYGQTNTITVTGTVTDTTGSPLPGIAIAAVDQTGIGTATDLNGKFVLEVAAGTRLRISAIGYQEQVNSSEERRVGKECVSMSRSGWET